VEDKILRRAKALLAMSEDASSEHEATLAMSRLHKMLAQYNITVHDLHDKPEEVGEQGFESIRWPWRNWVVNGVSSLYFCEHYLVPTKKNYCEYFIVGTETNRLFAQGIIESIFRTIDREGRKQSKIHHGKVDSHFITSFNKGAGMRIYRRCNELIDAAKEGTLEDEDGNNMPMLLDVYSQHIEINKAFTSGMSIKLSKSSTRSSDAAGYAAGKKAADKVQLSRAIQSKSTTKLLGY
jgi:hypothetical protein